MTRPQAVDAPSTPTPVIPPGSRDAVGPVVLGAVLGIAWSSSLRGWMAQVAGAESTFTWLGTFVAVILPGAMAGALLGWAEHLRRTGGRRRRWLAFSPLLLPIAALSLPGALARFLATGLGGGAVGVVLFGLLGGVALGGRGPGWLRILCGVVGFVPVPLTFLFSFRPGLDPGTPLGVWMAVDFAALFGTLAVACAIPLRRPARPGDAAVDP